MVFSVILNRGFCFFIGSTFPYRLLHNMYKIGTWHKFCQDRLLVKVLSFSAVSHLGR